MQPVWTVAGEGLDGGEVALLDAVGLHDVAGRMEADEKIVRRLVYSAVSEVCAPAA